MCGCNNVMVIINLIIICGWLNWNPQGVLLEKLSIKHNMNMP